jgi:hypothetical protein
VKPIKILGLSLMSILSISTAGGISNLTANANQFCLDQESVELCSIDENFASFSGYYKVDLPEENSINELSVHKIDGPQIEIIVSSDNEGEVSTQVRENSVSLGSTVPTNGPNPMTFTNCGSATYHTFLSHTTIVPFRWYYNPRFQYATNSIYRIREAALTWSKGKNRCNSTIIENSFQSIYEGTTTNVPAISTIYVEGDSGEMVIICGTQSSENIVAWGIMPDYVAGAACKSYFGTTSIAKSSVKLSMNPDVSWYTNLSMSECAGDVDLKGVMTHEFGHVIGLDHYTHIGQTMKHSTGYCDMNSRGLGYGDVHGAAALYPN